MLKLIKDDRNSPTFPLISAFGSNEQQLQDSIFQRKALISTFNRRVTETRERIIKQVEEQKYETSNDPSVYETDEYMS